jgi:hypothetical protein
MGKLEERIAKIDADEATLLAELHCKFNSLSAGELLYAMDTGFIDLLAAKRMILTMAENARAHARKEFGVKHYNNVSATFNYGTVTIV